MTTIYGTIENCEMGSRRNSLTNFFEDDEFDYLPLPEIDEGSLSSEKQGKLDEWYE